MTRLLHSFDNQVALVLAILVVLGTVSIAIGAGYLFGSGIGWLSFGVLCGFHALGMHNTWKEMKSDADPTDAA